MCRQLSNDNIIPHYIGFRQANSVWNMFWKMGKFHPFWCRRKFSVEYKYTAHFFHLPQYFQRSSATEASQRVCVWVRVDISGLFFCIFQNSIENIVTKGDIAFYVSFWYNAFKSCLQQIPSASGNKCYSNITNKSTFSEGILLSFNRGDKGIQFTKGNLFRWSYTLGVDA